MQRKLARDPPARTRAPTGAYPESLCARCKGTKYLCGKNFCPLVKRNAIVRQIEAALGGRRELFGPSPPGVFVGSWGYPKVLTGPLVPPVDLVQDQDPAFYDEPAAWLAPEVTLARLLEVRASLVRGKHPIEVTRAREPFGHPVLADIQEIVISTRPVDSEMTFTKPPRYQSLYDNRVAPMGPSSELERLMVVDNPSVPRKVDRLVYDTDARAATAVTELTGAGITHQQIQRVFSVGLLGTSYRRRVVPTKWSITAVDDIVGRFLHRQVKTRPWINDTLLFRAEGLANSVSVVLYPSAWQFEVLEGWTSAHPSVASDHELHGGRTKYADVIEGAYYAVRHPVLQWLAERRRQAGVLVFLEVDTPKWVPLGVWRFRELASKAMTESPRKFPALGAALHALGKQLLIPLPTWTRASTLVERRKTQRTLLDYFKVKPKRLDRSPVLHREE